MYNLLVVLGPTASGKTKLAVHLAYALNAEIISADSRQVYCGMDIGTGKDLNEYIVNGNLIRHHLINIRNAGDSYHVADFQDNFYTAYDEIERKGKLPLLCGGTAVYIDAVLKNYAYTFIPVNQFLREELVLKTDQELRELFHTQNTSFHSLADLSTRKRTIRAIEIGHYLANQRVESKGRKVLQPLIIGLNPSVETRRSRITDRLEHRLENGLVEEVKTLLSKGVSADKLIYYGLEYKFNTEHLMGNLSYGEMKSRLNTAIHQFAKRQMTYFRKMERDGLQIRWIDEHFSLEKQIEYVTSLLNCA